MKIRTDAVPSQNTLYHTPRKSSAPVEYSSTHSLNNIPQNLNIKLRLERVLTEALNIAQVSMNMLEKAQLTALSIRNMESSGQKISEIITEYGTVAPEISAKRQIFTENNIKEIPSIAEDISKLAELKNKTPLPMELEFLDSSIRMKIESVQVSINQIEKRITGLYPAYSRKNTSFYTEMLTHTALMIIKNANSALAMQGNISRESITRLNIA